MKNSIIIPERLLLETVFGCNARCKMCPVHLPTSRKKGVMTFELFKYVIDELGPYKYHIQLIDLFGMGEPLLDNNLDQKICYAKSKGFKNLAIATNADLLNEKKVSQLYQSGLDTIIISIDGSCKETHERIRINTNFNRIVDNAKRAILIRDKGDFKTKLIFRFIIQDENKQEWPHFQQYWLPLIAKERGDKITGYEMHTWGGEFQLHKDSRKKRVPQEIPCHHLFDRLVVLCDGTVSMCCSDLHQSKYSFGHVKDDSPMNVFNSKKANAFRKIHTEGNRYKMKICQECSILESECDRKEMDLVKI